MSIVSILYNNDYKGVFVKNKQFCPYTVELNLSNITHISYYPYLLLLTNNNL